MINAQEIDYQWLIKKLKTESNNDLDIYRNIRAFLHLPIDLNMFNDKYHLKVLEIIKIVYELSPQIAKMNEMGKIKMNRRYE